jgi:hypothetical protein
VTTSDAGFRERLIRRALELRRAAAAPSGPTWTRDRLEQATARNHHALAVTLTGHHIGPDLPDRQLEDREAEP